MIQELTALDTYYLVKECEAYVDGKIDHIYQPDKNIILLQLHKTGIGKKIFRLAFPSFAYFSDHKGQMPEKPTGLCMFLRKHLKSGRIRAITQVEFDRIIEITIEKKDASYKLYIELIHPGNLVICKDNKIMVALVQKKWKDRVVRPGVPYEHPTKEHSALKVTEVTLRSLFAQEEREVVRVLATELGLGGKYAEELCARAKIKKDAHTLTHEETESVLNSLKEMLNQTGEAFVVKQGEEVVDIIPFPLQKYLNHTLEQHPTFSEALDSVLTTHTLEKKEAEVSKSHDKVIGKSERILEQQKRMLVSVEEGQLENQACGEAIYENYQTVDEVLATLKEARKTHSWKEIKEKVKGHPLIKDIKEKEGHIIIELPDKEAQ